MNTLSVTIFNDKARDVPPWVRQSKPSALLANLSKCRPKRRLGLSTFFTGCKRAGASERPSGVGPRGKGYWHDLCHWSKDTPQGSFLSSTRSFPPEWIKAWAAFFTERRWSTY